MSTILPHMAWSQCEFRMQVGNVGGWLEIQDAKYRHFGTIGQLYRAVSSQLRHVSIDNREKSLLNTDTSSTCPHNNGELRPTND